MSTQPIGKITYEYQHRKCGKATCKTCQAGKGHGPYWYAYWHELGTRKMYSRYIGKQAPQHVGTDDVDSTG